MAMLQVVRMVDKRLVDDGGGLSWEMDDLSTDALQRFISAGQDTEGSSSTPDSPDSASMPDALSSARRRHLDEP
jgi:hypothetical protein